ncbi:MAG: DUF309 domain-containing protein [Pseudanabaenaceae cyanobacterium]
MDNLTDQWHRAIALFNAQEFYTCHDLLEEIWHNAPMDDRQFYQGILQIAVGLYHLQRQNIRGAMGLLGTGISNLRAFHPHYHRIDVSHLVAESYTIWQNLQTNQLPSRLPQILPIDAE